VQFVIVENAVGQVIQIIQWTDCLRQFLVQAIADFFWASVIWQTNSQLPQLDKISKTKSDSFRVSGEDPVGCRSPAFCAQASDSFLALAACHKGEALEQVHVLFVLQQRAVQFR